MTLLLASWAQPAPTVAIEHVNVVDVRAATIHADQTVVLRGRQIEAVGKVAPAGARRIDGRGNYLIPGRWDMPGHLGLIGPASYQLLLAKGVTGLREMECSSRDFERLKQYRAEAASGKTVGPDLVATAEAVERRGAAKPAPFGVENAVDARAAVDRLQKIGADFVTVGPDVPRPA